MASLLSKIGVTDVEPMGLDLDPGCSGKMGYSAKEWAERAIAKSKSDKGGCRNVYRCASCRQWHVGSLAAKKW